jgi:hypothetical protein
MNRYASRKFLVAILALLLAAFLRWRGVLSDDGTVTVMVSAILGYPTANVAQAALTKGAP